MSVLQTNVLRQVENYLNDDRSVSSSGNDNGWIPLESIHSFTSLSAYPYETIIEVLRSHSSSSFELSSFQPYCVRKRSRHCSRTVLVEGLPNNVTHQELFEFFQSFYPIDQLEMFPSTENFDGNVHLIFTSDDDARRFVEQSNDQPIVYIKNHYSRYVTEHRLTCRFVNDESRRPTSTPKFFTGKSFSTRLQRSSTRLSSTSNDDALGTTRCRSDDAESVSSPTQSSISSNNFPTEQTIFPQNLPPTLFPKFESPKPLPPMIRTFAYDFYVPNHLLHQTHPCLIISLLNPHCFTLQLQEDAAEFDKFQREINQFYNKHLDDSQLFIAPEQIESNLCVICADTKTLNDEIIWNRSQILSWNQLEKTVNLFHVDIGTWEENVPLNRLRSLLESFHQPLVFSLTCRLGNIVPLTSALWSDDATQMFQNLVENIYPSVIFSSRPSNGCFRVHLSISIHGETKDLSDYLIDNHQAKYIDDSMMIDDDSDPTHFQHPVVALYHRLAESSHFESYTTSSCSSSVSSSSQTGRSHVKIIPIHITMNHFSRRLQQNHFLIFIRYEKFILIPDFNVQSFLQTIDPTFDLETIETYADFKGSFRIEISSRSHQDIFNQLIPLMKPSRRDLLVLYRLDFVRDILNHYKFSSENLYSALDEAKRIQMRSPDLIQWFMDEEHHLNTSTSPSNFPSRSIGTIINEDQYPTPSIDPPSLNQFSFSNRVF